MKSFSNRDRELFDLVDDLCNGAASHDQYADLDRALLADPAARRTFLRYLAVHAELSSDDTALAAFGTTSTSTNLRAAPLVDRNPAPVEAAGNAIRFQRRAGDRPSRGGRSMPSGKSADSWWQLAATGITRLRAEPIKPTILAAVALVAVSLSLALAGFPWRDRGAAFSHNPPALTVASLTAAENCQWAEGTNGSTTTVGTSIPANTVYNLRQGRATLTFNSGATTVIEGPTEFVVHSASGGYVRSGSIAAQVPPAAAGFCITTPAVQVVDLGTRFTTQVSASGNTIVAVQQGLVEVRPLAPRHYWNFDEPGNLTRDVVSGQKSIFGRTAQRVDGLVGRGAAGFNNTVGSAVFLGNSPATGRAKDAFSAKDGLTVEAVFVSHWSGQANDFDHIFRKEDQEHRVLLAFQPPGHHGIVSMPPIYPDSTLSFGLYLTGEGYQELDMPLDGKAGRPKLSELVDGKLHHVAGVYDAATGEKSLYVDGRRAMSMNYPAGTQIVSGGSASAVIGSCSKWINESFNGIVDEVAWYDFALSAEEIARHYDYVRRGQNYFGQTPGDSLDAQATPSVRLKAGESREFRAGSNP